MSFPNFEGGQQAPQPTGEDQGGFGGPGANSQQPNMGQQMDPAQQQAQFPGAQGGAPGAPGSQGSDHQKTTLW